MRSESLSSLILTHIVNRWVAVRVNSITSLIVACIGVLVVIFPSVSAAQAVFALSFATLISMDVSYFYREVLMCIY